MTTFSVNLTHDVDRIAKSYQYITQDIFKKKIRNLKTLFTGQKPYWMFERIMALEEHYNVRSTFFFLNENKKLELSKPGSWHLSMGRYSLDMVENIMKKLSSEGWEIGLHGSFDSYQNAELLKEEKTELEKSLGKEILGIRQHYLNLDIPKTWIYQKQAGLQYDATLGKLGGIGFVDFHNRPYIDEKSQMMIIPLTFMEYYLFQQAEFNPNKAWELALDQINNAERNNAVLSILWHQRYFNDQEFPGYSDLYENIIVECKSRNATFKTCEQLLHEHYGK